MIKMWARIQNGKVVELTDIDPDGRYHPSMTWVSCGETVRVGMTHSDGEFGPPAIAVDAALSEQQVEVSRLHAYADPVVGSDRLFVEASRMQMMGEHGWEAVRDAAVVRYQEIQNEHPWP